MKKYSYKVRDWSGKASKGIVEANSVAEAVESIRSSGFVPLQVSEYSKGIFSKINSVLRSGVSKKDMGNFTRQLATMMTAGLPMTDALSLLKNQSEKNAGFGEVLEDVLARVRSGSSLASALGRYEKYFGKAYVASVAAGEEGGVLESILTKMADNMEVENGFRGKVKGAMVYPAIVIVGMVIVVIIMMLFVIPKLSALYDDFGSEMPAITQALMTMSDITIKLWFLLPTIPFGLISLLKIGASSASFRYKRDYFFLKIPIWGDVLKKSTIANTCRTLSMLLTAGIPFNDALTIVAEVAGSEVYKKAYLTIRDRVEKGFSISDSFAEHEEIFFPIVHQMVTTGEETGKLDEVLMRVAEYFTTESEQAVKSLTSAIEPAIIIVLGAGVGFLVVAVIMPIYDLTSQF